MSRHWDPNRSGWPGQGNRHRWRNSHRAAPARGRRTAAEFGIAFALAIALGLVYAARPAAGPFGPGAEPGTPRDVRIVDGDTFDHGSIRIRIADIDAPEVRGRCAHERELASRATSRMRALLVAGPFELERTGTRDVDVYGRKLRIVTRGGRSLGATMVAEGLARPWRGHREPWC